MNEKAPRLHLILKGDNCWPDLKGVKTQDVTDMSAALLLGGMNTGRSSVTFRINTPNGTVVLAETSLDLLETAVKAFRSAERSAEKTKGLPS